MYVTAFQKYPVIELTFRFIACESYISTHGPRMALGLQFENPKDVKHKMNVFCVFTLYLERHAASIFRLKYPALQT